MKNRNNIHWMWLGLVICLLGATPAHAFYNPQQGAGRVGGLVVVNARPSTDSTAYDGNGNVAALVNANDGTLTANYEYGPFGEVIRMSGVMATINPFRFSTKYQDNETDLLYYGYRFYNSSQGRWLNRDPLEENGGNNLYGFVNNNPIMRVDHLGLKFEDQGEVYVFGLTGNKAATSQTFRLKISYQSEHCVCLFKADPFLVRTKTMIALYDAQSIWIEDNPPPYKPYTSAEVSRNSIHEAKHRKHAKQWHDMALDGIMRDFIQVTPCDQCEDRKNEIIKKWDKSWDDHMKKETAHNGSDWTYADRNPTDGEINEDPNSWLWVMPNPGNLEQEIPNPY